MNSIALLPYSYLYRFCTKYRESKLAATLLQWKEQGFVP